MIDNILKSNAFKLKGRLYTLTVLSVLDVDYTLFAQQLSQVVAQAPRLFRATPVVLDCSAINPELLDLQKLMQLLRDHGLIPIGIQGGGTMLETVAQCHGLAVLNASSTQDKPIVTPRRSAAPKAVKAEPVKTKLLTMPVRSGQQVVSQGDLVLTAAVSPGAELLADGNIHVYGTLRGRALAGISGNKEARIFCQSLEAELVSIAGFYRLKDAIEPMKGPCQIYLQDDRIQIELL